jgi:hypothetical protein
MHLEDPSEFFHWLKRDDDGQHTASNTTTNKRDETSVHHSRKDTEKHNQTVPGKMKKQMATGWTVSTFMCTIWKAILVISEM